MEYKIIQSAATSTVVIVLGWQMLGRLKSKLSITSILTIYHAIGHNFMTQQVMLESKQIK